MNTDAVAFVTICCHFSANHIQGDAHILLCDAGKKTNFLNHLFGEIDGNDAA